MTAEPTTSDRLSSAASDPTSVEAASASVNVFADALPAICSRAEMARRRKGGMDGIRRSLDIEREARGPPRGPSSASIGSLPHDVVTRATKSTLPQSRNISIVSNNGESLRNLEIFPVAAKVGNERALPDGRSPAVSSHREFWSAGVRTRACPHLRLTRWSWNSQYRRRVAVPVRGLIAWKLKSLTMRAWQDPVADLDLRERRRAGGDIGAWVIASTAAGSTSKSEPSMTRLRRQADHRPPLIRRPSNFAHRFARRRTVPLSLEFG